MNHQPIELKEWRHFDDRGSDDHRVGPARKVEIQGRCTSCWGPLTALRDIERDWIRIECQLCRCSVDGVDANRESARMRREVAENVLGARIGRASKYSGESKFVLKILPDMDRDKSRFEQRVYASRKAGSKKHRLDRNDFPLGTAGYLYAQARALTSGLENIPREIAAISLRDFEFGEPRVVDTSADDSRYQATGSVTVTHRKPSGSTLMARMGTCLVAGMTAAFACEVGIKAVLMTRRYKAEMTHDLLKLYNALPTDCRERLEADFPAISQVLRDARDTFGKWRYFEQRFGNDAMTALVNTDRVAGLAKAARVMLDECVIAGLDYDIRIYSEIDFTAAADNVSHVQQVCLSVDGEESAIPWDRILSAETSGLRNDLSSHSYCGGNA